MSGAAVIGLLFGMGAPAIASTLWTTTTSRSTLELLVILYGIAVFEYTLRISGMLNRLIVNLKKVLRDDRLVLGTLPAFLGFLPSPGGALFSAPLVEEASSNLVISAEQKSFINYWFRHIWETAFPLFPGLIMASVVSKVPLYKLAWIMFPVVFINVFTGSLIVFSRKFPAIDAAKAAALASRGFSARVLLDLIINLFPLILIIAGKLLLDINIVLLIASVILWTFLQAGILRSQVPHILSETLKTQNLMLIVAIMFFAGILDVSGAARAIPATFQEMNVPRLFIFMGMPFVLAIFTGINTAFVGLSFPILAQMAGGSLDAGQVTLVYLSGCAGVMLSPVHLCFILTVNYFKANLFSFYRMLMAPSLAMLLCAVMLGRL